MFFQRIEKILKRNIKHHFYDIPIAQCVHYCAFRYGSKCPPPYECYIRTLDCGRQTTARDEFIESLIYYRPGYMQEAIGITDSDLKTALWRYPWNNNTDIFDLHKGWSECPNEPPDIMTHFSPAGILRFRIEQEFAWLENSYYNMKKNGFRNDFSNDSCRLYCLEDLSGTCRYIVENGNHRIAALAALGAQTVSAEIIRTIRASEVTRWPGVISGIFSREEALNIFNAYFSDTEHYRTTSIPAKVIETV